jgi:hypothetical protein
MMFVACPVCLEIFDDAIKTAGIEEKRSRTFESFSEAL